MNINAVKRITQYLMLGDFDNVQSYCNTHHLPDDLNAWAIAKIYRPLTPHQESLLNQTLQAQYRGWQAYLQGNYIESHQYFSDALNFNTEDSQGAGLGLAKVYTRLGYWEAAKHWLLYELPTARSTNDLFMQAQCYGALGEVFLRSGHPKLAYESFGNSFYVLPKGSSQREKQLNYEASALMRTGNLEQAEQYLMSALYLAANKQIDSVWHSLARLQFLWLQQNKNESVQTYYADYLHQTPNIQVAEGFLNIANAFLAYRQHNIKASITFATEAVNCFKSEFPIERYWAQKILRTLNKEAYPLEYPLEDVIQLPPKSTHNLIESPWLNIQLPLHGFEPLQKAESLEQLYLVKSLFFI